MSSPLFFEVYDLSDLGLKRGHVDPQSQFNLITMCSSPNPGLISIISPHCRPSSSQSSWPQSVRPLSAPFSSLLDSGGYPTLATNTFASSTGWTLQGSTTPSSQTRFTSCSPWSSSAPCIPPSTTGSGRGKMMRRTLTNHLLHAVSTNRNYSRATRKFGIYKCLGV